MESIHRLSMNTSLKNARIFDDDAWDDSGDVPVRIKKECPDTPVSYDEIKNELSPSCVAKNAHCLNKPIKQEYLNDRLLEEGELEDSFMSGNLNLEYNDSVNGEGFNNVKTEVPDPPSPPDIGCETSWLKVKLEKPKTPSPPHINEYISNVDIPEEKVKEEQIDYNMFDNSPYNNDLLKKWRIKESTPIKFNGEQEEPSTSYQKRACFKSARRTVFNRPSPYKTGAGSTEPAEPKVSVQDRLGTKTKFHRTDIDRSKPKQNMETDPECLARREKQIEYGKNTIGYENYTKLVPRSERKPDDPKTPPKYKKYSRRGWEGLVKQWRIKLHKYDPPETTDS